MTFRLSRAAVRCHAAEPRDKWIATRNGKNYWRNQQVGRKNEARGASLTKPSPTNFVRKILWSTPLSFFGPRVRPVPVKYISVVNRLWLRPHYLSFVPCTEIYV
jgi:hypothetical protein